MKLSTGQSSGRAVYYDRNPLQASIFYSAVAIGPHGITSRSVYTVPAGRKAFVEVADLSVVQTTAGTVAGIATAQVSFTGGVSVLVNRFSFAAGTIVQKFLSSLGMLGAGQTTTIFTGDANTGGTSQFDVYAKVTEFDA